MKRRLLAARRWLGRLTLLGLLAGVLMVQVLSYSTGWMRYGARGHMYSEAAVPQAPVALVLGAQVYAPNDPSPFLVARLEIARRLLVAGKVKVILVSGDHREFRYDEPGAMRHWLMAHGVPADRIVEDHAGFDTYDSCVRALKIFGVRKLTVVTQTYHLARAVTLCRHHGIDAAGVGDDTVRQFRVPWRISSTREYGACVKAVYDVVSGRDPVFLGRRESSVDDALAAAG